jgi:hypothetical protein
MRTLFVTCRVVSNRSVVIKSQRKQNVRCRRCHGYVIAGHHVTHVGYAAPAEPTSPRTEVEDRFAVAGIFELHRLRLERKQ